MPLSPPPRDGNGEVTSHDHKGIDDADKIVRRISPEHIVPDEKAASGRRVSKLAFQASTDGNQGMSVDIEKLILEAQLNAAEFVTQPPFIGSVWFAAGFLRSKKLAVGPDPIAENPYHGEVWGNFTDGTRKAMLRAAQWYVEIKDVDLHVPPPVAA